MRKYAGKPAVSHLAGGAELNKSFWHVYNLRASKVLNVCIAGLAIRYLNCNLLK